jgi:hypothetical protein
LGGKAIMLDQFASDFEIVEVILEGNLDENLLFHFASKVRKPIGGIKSKILSSSVNIGASFGKSRGLISYRIPPLDERP